MADIQLRRDDITVENPVFVEGLPGIGLVGKIAADHLVDTFDMVEYATIHCDGLPEVAVFAEGESTYRPPVRIYADEERDLLVLQSDVPVSPSAADEFAGCLAGWLADHDALPLFLSGLPAEKEGVPDLSGVASDGAADLLSEYDIDAPTESGVISGPTGALLYESERVGLPALGLVVEANQNFPDPEAARVLLLEGIEPVAGVSVETESLVEQAEEVSAAREKLAKQMQEAGDESSSAQPIGMYQ
jgi:uncharacterized protein